MNVLNSFLPLSAEHLPLLLHGSLKALLVLLLTAGVAFLLRRRGGAALRHWIWSLGLSGVLLIPVLMVLVPAWSVPIAMPGSSEQVEAAAGTDVRATPATGALPATPRIADPEGEFLSQDNALSAPPATAEEPPVVLPEEPTAPPFSAADLTWQEWVLALWLTGTAVVALYFAAGSLYARQLIRRGRTNRDATWEKHFRSAARQLDLRRPVQLVWSDRAAMPFTWGIFHPVIVLPASAREWSAERRQIVLLHEGTHIKRWDCLTQAVGQLACTLHWFNPLAWWASRRLRVERERATDDYVLEIGTRPSTYAEHLLELARSLSRAPGAPFGAVSMAKPSQLEGRLLSILNPDTRRQTLGRLGAYLTSGLFLALILPLSAMQPAESSDAAPPAIEEGAVATSDRAASEAPDETAHAQESAQGHASSEQDPIQETFQVGEGGLLNLDTERGSIAIETGEGDEVTVEVHVDEREREDWFDVDFEQRGDDVHVRGSVAESGGFLSWLRNLGSPGVRFEVTVPERYNLDLHTSGGSIEVDDLEGAVAINTSGGNIRLGAIDGPVDAETAGGSIQLAAASQDAQVRTSGGSIRLGPVQGSVEARTSGGSIAVDGVAGSINARTSGGSITAHITEQPQGDSELRTSGGSVTAYIAEGIGLDLHARTSAGRVSTDLPVEVQGEASRSELRGTIGGGGPALSLRTSAGSIRIHGEDATAESENGDWGFNFDEERFQLDEERFHFDEDWSAWDEEDVRELEHSIEEIMQDVEHSVESAVAGLDVVPMANEAHGIAIEALVEVIREFEEPFADGEIRQNLYESLAEMLEDQAYRDPTITLTRYEGEEEEVSVIDLLAELPAEVSDPALARLAEDHPDPEIREEAGAALNRTR